MFKIGDFSRLSMVPVTALRYYADTGLIEPVWVDPETGYRYYSADQLPRVNRVLALKDLGLALDQIRAILDDALGAEELRGMLRLKQAELGRQVAEDQERLARVESRLRLIEKEGVMPTQEILVKHVDTLRGLGCRDAVGGPNGIPDFIGDVFGAIMPAGIQVTAPPVTIYHDLDRYPDEIDIELVVPVAEMGSGLVTPAGRTLEERMVPGGEVAVTIHVGPYETIHESCQALAAWVGDHGYQMAGPHREIYLTGPDEPGPPITEIGMPVARGAG